MNQQSYNLNAHKRRRLKYGSLAVALTVAVIALVVIVNAIFTSLAYRFFWYVDMTEAQIYEVSQSSIDLLDGYRGTDEFEITITFCMPRDQLDSQEASKMVHNLAMRYEREFDFITVEYIDIINNPNALKKYYNMSITNAKTTSVIISSENDARLYNIESFFTFDSDTGNVFAFNGEYKITAGILQLAGDKPIAYFVKGHGEEIEGSVMKTLFEDAGYEVRTIDLTQETPDDAAKVMVINNPKYDFSGSRDTAEDESQYKGNEIKKLDAFLDNFGGLMVFMDAGSQEMPVLSEFLEEWGIAFENKIVRDYNNALDVNGYEISATYATEGNGAALTKSLRELENPPKAIVNNARPISILFEEKYMSANGSTRYVSPVLTSASDRSAVAIPITGGDPVKGLYNLMTVSIESQYIDNESHNSYVLAAGTSSFADDKYIGRSAYANRDIIFNVMKQFGKKTVPLDLDFKVFQGEELDLTKGEANTWTVICTLVFPVIISGVGIYVYVRRRYL